jgi:Caudovirus prohead serine protease
MGWRRGPSRNRWTSGGQVDGCQRCYGKHEQSQPIGTWLELREDHHGLFGRGRLADTQLGREARTLLKDGAVSGLSIGFRTRKYKIDSATGIRTLLDVQLMEISVVTFPRAIRRPWKPSSGATRRNSSTWSTAQVVRPPADEGAVAAAAQGPETRVLYRVVTRAIWNLLADPKKFATRIAACWTPALQVQY